MKSIFSMSTARHVAIAAAMLVPVFQASAEPPPAGSQQAKDMAPFKGFIKSVRVPNEHLINPHSEAYIMPYHGFTQAAHAPDGQWCCTPADGRAHMKEKDNGDGSFEVFVTLEAYPKLELTAAEKAEGGKWVHVPATRIVSGEAIAKTIKDCKEGSGPSSWPIESCKAPSFNMVWANPQTGSAWCYYKEPRPG